MVLVKRNRGIIALALGLFILNVYFSKPDLSRRQLSNADEEPFKPLNILTLGGSITWGVLVNDPYPSLLQKDGHNVMNLGVRGHGSDYPAQCIYSMLKEDARFNPNTSFDVIILEFSVNGTVLFDLLIKRLQERYPDALFIYVDLISLVTANPIQHSELSKIRNNVNGNMYSFPKPKSRNSKEMEKFEWLYARDNHHLNHEGHKLVKDNIDKIISKADIPEKLMLGSWHGGDSCHSIFGTGQVNFDFVGNATFSEFDTKKQQYAVDIGNNGAVLQYRYDGEHDTDITLGYMTKCTGEDPHSSIYPPVVIKIEQTDKMIRDAMEDFKNGDFHVSLSEDNHVKSITDGWNFLDSVYIRVRRRKYHQSQTSIVGVVKPGLNFIYVQPLEKKENPFRVTSTVVCEACGQLQLESTEIM